MKSYSSQFMTLFTRLAAPAMLLASALLTGCGGGGDAANEQLKIGFAQVGAESVWRTANTDSLQNEAKKRGVDFKFSSGEGKQENQIRAIRSFVAQGVDLIILSPIVETGWDPVLKEAKRAGIPVLLMDREIDTADESLYAAFIGSDFVEEGRLAAQWMVENVKGDEVKIVELEGTPGSAPAIDRQNGFKEVVDKHSNFTIIESQSANFRRSDGKDLMESLLKLHSDIDVVYSHNDDMALGAIQAIEAAGLKPGTDIIIISIDAIKEAFEAVVAGKINCIVECTPLFGPLAFDMAEKILNGEPYERRVVMKDGVFDQTNAAEVIDSRKY
ncbi:ABC transporter substrate-binding protein [Pelagicoccus sp. SDUM812002]|uniref:ABC transporter substrate-binding protein n=1 Tax=Pelagicoccus sp. SDUM812002 TaxID=3041266 RepID=UPI00280E750F|nr:ABC transporter substrate-binding protein [Pelagicoccus sp. SDUM812002]MDQ8184484.1 ABC transporter substrate-binding protein [Pelagicoccus sp. SDUM812002]